MKKTVLITGSSRGIGRATAALFKKRGWRVVGVDKLSGAASVDLFLKTDLSGPEAAHEVKALLTKNSIMQIDALINNAAVQTVKPFAAITRKEWHMSFAVNAETPFFLAQVLLPQLQKARGSIVNVASIHTRLTKKHFSLYAATKGALVAMTQALAVELAPLVRVNGLAPATVVDGSTMFPRDRVISSLVKYNIAHSEDESTEALRAKLADFYAQRTLTKLPITPADQAEVAYLISTDAFSKTTGQVFSVDGGLLEAFLR